MYTNARHYLRAPYFFVLATDENGTSTFLIN
jgi:hypothetical protein